MDTITTSVILSAEQREKLAMLVGWLGFKNGSEVLRALLEDKFAEQSLMRSEIDGPIFVGDWGSQAS